jgi:23S rRNA (uracil1939-C5)-methyltransferase
MTITKGQTLELDITDIAFGGRGLTRIDGLAVFVDQAVPGDRVLARVYRKKKNYAEAKALKILNPSCQRVTAPCPYSGYCGGCKWQFLDYATQLRYKQQHVNEALIHIGAIHDVPVHPTLPSELIFGYRNKMEFSCATRRWVLPQEMDRDDIQRDKAIGLHVPGTFDKVMDIETCLLQPARGNDLLQEVRAFIQASALPVYNLRTHEGFWRFIVIRHSAALDQWLVNLVTAFENQDHLMPLARRLQEKFANVVGVVNNITARKSGVAIGEKEIILTGQAGLVDRVGPFEFELSANSFFQTNSQGASVLYDTVRRFVGLTGRESVLDLYCGTGTIAIYLASMAKQVVGIEMVGSSVQDAQNNCRRNNIDNCRFVQGDIRAMLPQINLNPDLLVIDPPRAGMHPDVVKQVLALEPPTMVYVSCNPSTLARDLAILKERYAVEEVQPVDMFPHTFHIESVARLRRLNQ